MNFNLRDIANIRFGSYHKKTVDNGIPYLQGKQFDAYGNMINSPDTFIRKENLKTNELLQDGDVIFTGKGNKTFAWTYTKDYGPAVASSFFFIIKPDKDKVLPEYLAIILNHPKSQLQFQQSAKGTSIFSIQKKELESFSVPVGPLALQQQIIAIDNLHQKQIALSHELIQKNSELIDSIITKLTNS